MISDNIIENIAHANENENENKINLYVVFVFITKYRTRLMKRVITKDYIF